jgi:putative ABC transport system permease protein
MRQAAPRQFSDAPRRFSDKSEQLVEPMIFTLAMRNLLHDRVRLAVTLVGILFSIVLVAVQLGLYLGSTKMIIGMIEHAKADLWIMPYGATSFEEAPQLPGRERYKALATPGVASAVPVVAYFAEWRKPDGGSVNSVIVGADPDDEGVVPWGPVEGGLASITAPDGIAIDKTYLPILGVNAIGDTAEIEHQRVRVTGLTEGIRSFTMSPYVFTTLNRARGFYGVPTDRSTFVLVRKQPGADLETVRKELLTRIKDVEVLTRDEFLDRSLDHWLFGTGAGVALIGGALLGMLVGTVIVAQTLYSSTKDHLNEFATLRALGSSSGYIHKVILTQASISGAWGYALGMGIALVVVKLSEQTPLPIVMTPGLAALLLALTLGMCAISAVSAIFKVTRIDPAMVFSR